MTLVYPDDPDEVLDWTPDEGDEDVTEWNPNPSIANPLWVPYVVDWQPPPPAESLPRIVDLDELENSTSDLIDLNIQDEDEDIYIHYIEISAGQLDHLHKIDEHPWTTSQAERMKSNIDEKTFPETPLPEDDEDDPWKDIEERFMMAPHKEFRFQEGHDIGRAIHEVRRGTTSNLRDHSKGDEARTRAGGERQEGQTQDHKRSRPAVVPLQ